MHTGIVLDDTQDHPRHILVVDDDPMAVALLSAWYELEWGKEHIKMSHASSLREALEILSDHGHMPPIDCLVVDCKLTDAWGLQAPIRLIQAMDATHAVLPTIVLTGTENATQTLHALAHGAQEFLTKNSHHMRQLLIEATLRAWKRYRFYEEGFNLLRKPFDGDT